MNLLHTLRNSVDRPAQPAGDPAEYAAIRARAYRDLFGGDPTRVISHDLFQKGRLGGRIDVHVYELEFDGEQVQAVVTTGMSDYRMREKGSAPCRRELIQYFHKCEGIHLGRLHDMAWLPLAQGYCLDYFHTTGPHPGGSAWPHSLFMPSLVEPHAEFRLELGGDEMQLLWHVPLSQAEFDWKAKEGLDALLERMGERQLPWVFDENTRLALV